MFCVESRKESSTNDEDMPKGLRASLKVLLPWRGDSVVVPPHISKGCRSGHMAKLLVQSPVRAHMRGN